MRLSRLAPLLLAVPLAAQQPPVSQPPAPRRQLTADDYARAERFLAPTTTPLVSGVAGRPTWLPDGRFWYRTTTAEGGAYVLVDPARRTRQPLLDAARLAAALGTATGRPVDARRLQAQAFEVAPDARAALLSAGGRRLRCDLQSYVCAADTTRTAGTGTVATGTAAGARGSADASVSPDGRWAAYIRDHNLWAHELATGRDVPLTTDGVPDFGYATDNAGWTHSDAPVLTWSPDSRRIATFQQDERGVGTMHLVGTNPGLPRHEAWKYPLPGDSVVFRISRVVVNLDSTAGPRVVRFQMPPDQHRSTVTDNVACDNNTVCDLQWFPDGSHVAFVSVSRDHKHAWVRVADARTGVVRTVLEETSPTQVGDASLGQHLWRVLPASNELVWWSQREGWLRLYLYDLATGRLKQRLTSGEGNVDEIVRVDERSRTLWFLASGKEPGRDPYLRHLYRVGLDGGRQTLLTPEDANHAVTASPDGRHAVDTYATPDRAPVTVLRVLDDGHVVLPLERADVSRLTAAGWRPPVPIRVKARDGRTDLYGLMYLPSRLDSTQKYPIVNNIYPGPQTGSVGPRIFAPSRGDNQALAELGFVVVQIDGMGTPGRSKAFADAYYGRMHDNTLPDQVAGMKELARRFRFIDSTRAGIWGHSGGGYATAAAMFQYPEFFRVGIAESGNHDNRSYEDDWGERYQGLLVRTGEADNYAVEANQTLAANLRGKLLLAHGGMDDNVPPANTLLVADALIKAGKDFDLIVIPNARHGYGAAAPYMTRRRWDYFVRHLLGAEPPQEYQIGRPRLAQ